MPLPPSRTSVVCKRDNGHAGSKLFVLLHKSMLNKKQLPYKPYYSTVFSICLDLYLHILERVRNKVLEVLQRDRPLWRVKNTCPACSYRLHDEKNLTLKTLVTMDGNNSLKRLRRTGGGAKDEADVRRDRYALPDSRSAPGDYYISREEVDKWAKEVLSKKRGAFHSVSHWDFTSIDMTKCYTSKATRNKAPVQADGPTWMTNSPPACGESLMRQGFSWRYVAMGLFCW